eukprot:g36278.t1
MAQEKIRVLSVQSSVVRGYVGNKASVFALQLLGLDVDPIHSVQFSNHTGYPLFSGSKTTGQELEELTRGLSANNFLGEYNYLVAGYMGSVSFIKGFVDLVKKMRAKNPFLTFVCDPVMGDAGKLYVPKELVGIYRDELVPFAQILTPNQTEAEHLCDVKIDSMASALDACSKLQAMGPSTVVLTSVNLAPDIIHIIAVSSDEKLFPEGRAGPGQVRYLHVTVRTIPGYFSGTGDLFAATLTAWLHKTGSLRLALEKCVNTVHAIIQHTHDAKRTQEAAMDAVKASRDKDTDKEKDNDKDMPAKKKQKKSDSSDTLESEHSADRELSLIQCKMLIEQPPSTLKVEVKNLSRL